MRYFIILLSLVNSLNSFGQQRITGKIVNTKKQPIPFASIGFFNSKDGTTSDAFGYFSINAWATDSIKISSIGYKSKTIIITKDSVSLAIELEEDFARLKDVIVRSRRRTTKSIFLGHYTSINNFYYLINVGEEATFIPNKDGIKGYIDEIKFKLDKISKTHFMLRVRVLNLNPETGLPYEDLLLSDNIITPKKLRRINSFSIKSKNIELPANGVFISFEWLATEGALKNENPPYLIGNSQADNRYVFANRNRTKWHRRSSNSPNRDGYDVPNVSIKVSY
ncbi:MAG: hypothetical protein JWQ96_1555 [Segetibacter sp.]|nr:hypothetical protein [Segetibacter sp.]